MKRATSMGVAFVVPFVLSACYTYMPAQVETVPPGEEVRLTLTRQGRLDLPETLEPEGPFINGKVTRRDAERLYINIPVAQQQQGFHIAQIAQEVGIRSGEIAQVELRKFDSVKSGLFVVGTTAVAAGIVFAIIEASSNSNNGGLPPVEEFRLPILSIPIR